MDQRVGAPGVIKEANRVRQSVREFVNFLQSSPFNEAIYFITAMRLEMQEIANLGNHCLQATLKIENAAKTVSEFSDKLNRIEELVERLEKARGVMEARFERRTVKNPTPRKAPRRARKRKTA